MIAADYLVELGTEELPPKALKKLSLALQASFIKQIKEAGLELESSEIFAAPRRLAILLKGLQTQQADEEFEKKGPAKKAALDKNGNTSKAVLGFARSNGIEVDQLETIDTPKGEWLVYRGVTKGRATKELLPEFTKVALAALPIPKRMRWGASRNEFVRPLQWLLMLENSNVIDCEIFDVKSSNKTFGHRFHYNQAIEITDPNSYASKLESTGFVIADFDKRQAVIKEQALAVGAKESLNVVIEDDLLEEVTALNEWPVALMGKFDEEFLQVPQEALVSSMNEHQKYFHTENQEGQIQPSFVFIANIESKKPSIVIEGNEKVIRPRLADAAFFWNTDKKTPLIDRIDTLKGIVFQKDLGSLFDKVERFSSLATFIGERTDANIENVKRAALLAKTDLCTDMVFEFTDLQGIAGQYYAQADGENQEVSLAINEHYMPRFAGDELPTTKAGVAVALGDRLDSLVGLFGIGQPPSGSKDPFALRRSSLGVLRILIEKKIDIDLRDLLTAAANNFSGLKKQDSVVEQVFEYMLDRFSAWYSDAGVPPSVYQAVRALKPSNPLDIDARVQAVNSFFAMPEAQALAAANKRVGNLLGKAEGFTPVALDRSLMEELVEIKLAKEIEELTKTVQPLIAQQNYQEALKQLATLRDTVDQFFTDVMVMADDEAVKFNRLSILAQLRDLFLQVADISVLQK